MKYLLLLAVTNLLSFSTFAADTFELNDGTKYPIREIKTFIYIDKDSSSARLQLVSYGDRYRNVPVKSINDAEALERIIRAAKSVTCNVTDLNANGDCASLSIVK